MTFSCDLSVDELVLVEEVGFEPIDLVMGSSYFHTGWQGGGWSVNRELENMTAVMLGARQMARARMLEQVMACGADGVVGLLLEIEREGHNAEFTMIGTAVRRKGNDRMQWRAAGGAAFTCDLSGADFWALVRGGFRPIGLALGVCVYHIAHQTLSGWFSTINKNTEMPAFTQALYDARELAMGRLQYEAAALGGTGVVGLKVVEGSHGWDSHVLELSAMGTAVRPIDDPTHVTHDAPTVVMGAQDR